MAPWWLRSRKDESYDDALEIDDQTLESIKIEPEPKAAQDDGDDEEAFAIGWEPGERSEKPPAAPPRGEDAARRGPRAAPDEDEQEAKPARKRRRRRKRKKPPADDAPESRQESRPKESRPKESRPKESRSKESRPKESRSKESRSKEPKAKDTKVTAPEESGTIPFFEGTDDKGIVFDFGLPERSHVTSDERKMALFCDLENIALGVRSSETKKFDITLVIERLLEKGKIIVKKAYADWERYSEFKRTFHEAAIELIDIPQKHYSGKNSADIKMVVDAMDLCYSKEHLDTFVILSGDSDFSPLVSKLKENNKFVIGVGVKGSTSSHLIDNCDEFIYYEDVWRDVQRTPRLDHLSPKEAEVFGFLIESILALVRENKSVLWGSMIKQTMQRKRPSFSEGYYDYSSFSDLLEDANKKKIIQLKRDQRSGNYVVTGFGRSS